MNKIKVWVLNNKKNILVGITSFLVLFVFVSSLWTAKSAIDRYENDKLKNACNEAYEMMCVQVHACSIASVEDCDTVLKSQNFCEQVELLPTVEIMKACKEDLRHIQCTDSVPGTCQTFME